MKFVHKFIDIYDVHIFGWALHTDSICCKFHSLTKRTEKKKMKNKHRENKLTGTKQKTNDYFISVNSFTRFSRSVYRFCVGSMWQRCVGCAGSENKIDGLKYRHRRYIAITLCCLHTVWMSHHLFTGGPGPVKQIYDRFVVFGMREHFIQA